jgi:hypothetical protein
MKREPYSLTEILPPPFVHWALFVCGSAPLRPSDSAWIGSPVPGHSQLFSNDPNGYVRCITHSAFDKPVELHSMRLC